MTCQHARDILPELLDPRTPTDAHGEERAHLASCAECQREFAALGEIATALDSLPKLQPTAAIKQKFYAMLEQEKQLIADASVATPRLGSRRRAGPSWRWILSPLIGCALVMAGFVAGQRSPATPRPSSTPSVAAVAPAGDSTKHELIALREQIDLQRRQLDKMTTLVGYSILQQQQNPANERLRDVLTAARSDNVNDKVLDDLIQALTLDPSANVRLRALEALYPHAERATVRAGVLAALPREQNPLVQLELIDFVATARQGDATPFLERISSDESANRTVRDAARFALSQF
jgi:hypothetical protein